LKRLRVGPELFSCFSQGHYVAYVAHMNGGHGLQSDSTVWLRCDDETVTPVSEDDVANVEG